MLENDLIGVGAGPTNLSLAALIETARARGSIHLQSKFFEKNQAVLWHSGQMFPGTLMQTEFYRDLVTPVDPTSPYSFLNYLKVHQRLDQFICSEYICPTRREFEAYLNWVARQLPDVLFEAKVGLVEYAPEANLFVLEAETGGSPSLYQSKHIVLGCGSAPDFSAVIGASSRVVHVSDLLAFELPNPLRSLLVVGSGQSAAECMIYVLDRYAEAQMQITWVTHETAFRALDKGNFSREAYSAAYGSVFAGLPAALREKTIREETDIAYGITPEFAKALYQQLYSLKYPAAPDGGPSVHMEANVEVAEVRDSAEGARVTTRKTGSGETTIASFDAVVLCTGFDAKSMFDSAMVGPELKSRIGRGIDRQGYAVAWDGPADRMIFLQSENTKTHGLGDANFITAPGRNASILNAITGQQIYRIDETDLLVAL
jgi:lysine N6-hydroxylase